MRKTGKISKAEKFYIESHMDEPDSKIAKELNILIESVEKTKRNYKARIYKKKILESAKIDSPPATPAEEPKGYAKSLYSTDRSGRYDYTIATPIASERADATRKNKKPKLDPSCVHRPLND